MRAKDRVLAQIHHQETDQVPYTIRYEEVVAEQLDAYYGSTAWRTRVDNAIRRAPGPELVVVEEEGEPYYTDPYGSRWRVDRRPYHLMEPVLDEASLTGFDFPPVEALVTEAMKREARDFIQKYSDHFVVIGFGFGLWERTFTLRGFEDALLDAAGNPGFFDELIGQVAAHQMEIVEHLLELPVDGILFSDDWGYQDGVLLGPDRWRRVMKPRLEPMYDRVHEAGKVTLSHCCGSVAAIMPDIIEIGLDVLESVQPEAQGMNPYQLKRQYGEQITFWGGLGSQSTIPFGTPEEIRQEVVRLCSEMGRNGGYILAPAKPLQPETPVENAAAVVEAFLKEAGVSFPLTQEAVIPGQRAAK
jgi:uroporphyrinogen decarboxylase